MLYNKAYGSIKPRIGKRMSKHTHAGSLHLTHQESVQTTQEQKYLLGIYSIVGLVVLGVFGVVQLIVWHNYLIGWIEITYSIVLFLNLLFFKQYHYYNRARDIFLFVILIFLLTLLVTGGTQGTGILWFFTFPFSAFFLAGKKQGAWWSSALLIATTAITIFASPTSLDLPYNAILLQQMILVLAVVTMMLYAYQRSREALQNQSTISSQKLQKERIKSDAVVENIGEAVVVTDPDGRIVVINAAAESMFGWQLSDLKGKKFADKVPAINSKNHTANTMRPIQQSLKSLSKVTTAITYVRKDGSSFPASITATPIVVANTLVGAVCTIRDIEEEQGVDKAKNEFVTLASHQLRTPASAIAWTSELLLSGDIGQLTDEQKAYVQKIYNSNRRLTDLLDDMLIVFSIELGNLSMVAELTDVSSVIRRVLKSQVKKLGNAKRLHVKETYDSTLPKILIDQSAIKSIVQRLISNAIKYTPDDGKLEIHANFSPEKLAPKSKGSILIEISDTGYGIPKHQTTKVFTKLFRADNIKKKDTDGTGLGLYIAKALTEQMGGKIWFESEQNQGSKFSVLLPIEGIKEPT